MYKPKKPSPKAGASPALIHENYLKAREGGLVMREADFRRRYHTLKHGLFTGSLEETVAALGEDPAEFKAFTELIERTFVPRNLPEYEVVRRMANAIWRRLRLYNAAARWEADALRHCLGQGSEAGQLTADETLMRGYGVMVLLMDETRLSRSRFKLLCNVERQLRALMRIRSGRRKARFNFISRQTLKEIKELEEDARYWRAIDRIAEGGPEVEAAIDKITPDWMRKSVQPAG